MPVHRPKWFSDDFVMVCTAPTCGLSRGGRLLASVDPFDGRRRQVTDPETGELINAVDDKLLADMESLEAGEASTTLRFVPKDQVSLRLAVPAYYDQRFVKNFREAMGTPAYAGFSYATLGDLVNREVIEIRFGHGSPSHDQRIGEVPYIKVSDLRAGLVNINPTNRVPRSIAASFWRGKSSGLREFDLLSPERTSKNIGDFCVLLPGQEQVVLTKEIIILRPGKKANFDPFYLQWAMTLSIVREQWKRVVFMQTNREDVGDRYLEIEIPMAPDGKTAEIVSSPFRNYYLALAHARNGLRAYLSQQPKHHFFVAGALEEPVTEDEAALIMSGEGK